MQDDLKEAQSRILQQIGRNIISYQYFETLLKSLISKGSISGYSNEIKNLYIKRLDKVNKSTMGSLSSSFLNTIFQTSEDPEERESPEHFTGMWVSMNLSIITDEDYINKRREHLKQITTDRNNLAHHFISMYDISSIEECREAECQIISQRERLASEILALEEDIRFIEETMKEFILALQSEEGKKLLHLSLIQSSKLACLLETTAIEIARKDGWAVLSSVAQHIQKDAPEELQSLYDKYKVNTLEDFILNTKLFDIYEEKTSKMGIRKLFRKNTDNTTP